MTGWHLEDRQGDIRRDRDRDGDRYTKKVQNTGRTGDIKTVHRDRNTDMESEAGTHEEQGPQERSLGTQEIEAQRDRNRKGSMPREPETGDTREGAERPGTETENKH